MTAISLLLALDTEVTVQAMELQNRPPLPLEDLASTERSEQRPTREGKVSTTEGVTGLEGLETVTMLVVAFMQLLLVILAAQLLELTLLGSRVMEPPGRR
jgi:hypothetical protein